MPSHVPNPVAAAVGLVPTVLDGVRRLPGKVVQLPVYAVSHALTSIDNARQSYDALAERGERLLARLRGTSFDEVEDVVEDALKGTPLAAPYDRVEDALEDATESVTRLVRSSTTRARKAAGTGTRTAGKAVDKAADAVEDASAAVGGEAGAAAGTAAGTAADTAKSAGGAVTSAAGKATDAATSAAGAATDAATSAAGAATEAATSAAGAATSAAEATPEAEAPKGEPTPKATEPDNTRISTAASADVVETVEQVSNTVGGEVLPHDELPLPDYDHLTLGSLRGRMRSLDLPQLIQIRDYEKAHADRLPIVTMLDNRIAKLANDPTAPLSGGSALSDVPEKPKPARRGSKVQPSTGGPAQNPPSQGVPTNPSQPRSSGSGTTNPDA